MPNAIGSGYNRDTHIDALRGFAVICMIIAHGIFFLYSGDSPVIRTFERFLNTITLTLFVFISGLVASKQTQAVHFVSKHKKISALMRYLLEIYIAYCAISIVGILLSPNYLVGHDLTQRIVRALTLSSPVNFTEYITLFLFLPIVSFAGSGFLHRIRSSWLLLCIVSGVSYLVGLLLYPIPISEPLLTLKALISGSEGLLQFPLLFYFPVYAFGIWWDSHASVTHMGYTILGTIMIFAVSIIFSIPVFTISIRWPPSIGFLSVGVLASVCMYFGLLFYTRNLKFQLLYRTFVYIGKDSLDYWLSHLLLLFLYARFIQTTTSNLFILMLSIIALFSCATLLTSIGVTPALARKHIGKIAIGTFTTRRFRKRYIAILFIGIVAVISIITASKSDTSYGAFMPAKRINLLPQQPKLESISLTSPRTWHILRIPEDDKVIVYARLNGENVDSSMGNLSQFKLFSSDTVISTAVITKQQSDLMISVPISTFPTGTHALQVQFNDSNDIIYSNSVNIKVSEPLLVAWTFDWEGWEPHPEAIKQIKSIRHMFSPISFTHFVSPRTYISDDVTPEWKSVINDFLLSSQHQGDEIALHIHMHYDLVQYSGIVAKNTPHWGLRSTEGYDVPTTSYTPEEFQTIVSDGKKILEQQGLTNILGYRAGGWYISADQLSVLQKLGFLYDSSGRSKPITGAFKNTPWNLPVDSQPFIIDFSDQNNLSFDRSNGLVEIPNNGLTTYDSTSDELIQRISLFYKEGELNVPKAIVYVSHPQFAQKEFVKIQPVLETLNGMSYKNDLGPVVFTTTGRMYSLWKTYLR